MDEKKWANCVEPGMMLTFLKDRLTPRKLRLFGCACFRQVWPEVGAAAKQQVELAEAFADGATLPRKKAKKKKEPDPLSYLVEDDAGQAANRGSFDASRIVVEVTSPLIGGVWVKARKNQVAIIKDLAGSPFRMVAFDPTWADANDGRVRKLAQTIYDDRNFADMPYLSDALEEAGCSVTAILEHCRVPADHWRGCWVIDGILERE